MLNNVSLVGRLVKDPEVKVIGDATSVCNFTLAVNRPYKDKDGEQQCDFIQCQAWKSQAEFIGSYVKKGHLITVTGPINTRNYTVDEEYGGKMYPVVKYVTEINVNQVSSLEKKSDTSTVITEASIKKDWDAEWQKRSVGLDSASKANLKKELTKKYDAELAKLDLPF